MRQVDRLATVDRLEFNLSSIGRNGGLIERRVVAGPSAWRLDFRARRPESGATRHRSIYLGQDEKLLKLVQDLLAARQKCRRYRKEQHAAALVKRRERRAMETELLQAVTGSRRHRIKIKRQFSEYLDQTPNPTVTGFLQATPSARSKYSRRGRPLKNRLW